MIRLIVADHHEQTLAALKTLLQEQQGIDLVAASVDGRDLLKKAASHDARVILVDRSLPGLPLTELLARLHALTPSPFVIVMGSQSEHSRSALHAGADAFVSKSDDPEWLMDVLRDYTRK